MQIFPNPHIATLPLGSPNPNPAPSTLSLGSTLHNNRYRIDAILGRGGNGSVYRALDTKLNVAVAIKRNLDFSPAAQAAFMKEAQLLAQLSHPNLPRVTDYFEVQGQGQYFVMDLIMGEDLETKVRKTGRLSETQALAWITQICDALNYLHNYPQPIIHRDIKPANIIIRADNTAVLVDFGIAKILNPHIPTSTFARGQGSPGFSPPEQYAGLSTTPASDIYALGATLYYLLTGQIPIESIYINSSNLPAPKQINAAVSLQVNRAVLRAMSVNAKDRYQQAATFKAALQQAKRWQLPLLFVIGVGLFMTSIGLGYFIAGRLTNNSSSSPTSFLTTTSIAGVIASFTPQMTDTLVSTATPTLPVQPVIGVVTPIPTSTRLLISPSATQVRGTATSTWTPTLAYTPSSTQIAIATYTPFPTRTPIATDRPAPTRTPIATDRPAPTRIPTATYTPFPTYTPIAAVASCHGNNSFGLSPSQLISLGCPAGVSDRSYIVQYFNNGFMIVLNQNAGGWAGGEMMYAILNNGNVYQDIDRYGNRTESIYPCQSPGGGRPEQTGIPWRGFGTMWCSSSALQQGIGRVNGGSAESFRAAGRVYDYANGRILQVESKTLVIYMRPSATFNSGRYDRR